MTEELFRADAYAQSCAATVVAAAGGGLVLDRTVFYPTGGGQPGDRGKLALADGATLEVVEAVKGPDGIIHRLAEGISPPEVGAGVVATVDWDRRLRLMRMHSGMHLLCAAVARPVTGGQVGEAKSRLDFDLQGEAVDKEAVAATIARWIEEDHPISHRWIDATELAERPDLVRTMSVRPPTTGGRVRLVAIEGIDLQACGGTHVASTAAIGALRVGKMENKGRQNRRINLALDD